MLKPWPETVGMSENDLLRGTLDLCRGLHWRTFHVRPGRTAMSWRTAVSGDGVGWPDIFAVKASRSIAIELKVGRGRLTHAQADWLEALRAAGVECHVFTEHDYPDRIAQVLT